MDANDTASSDVPHYRPMLKRLHVGFMPIRS
jgi:hypothetical protein